MLKMYLHIHISSIYIVDVYHVMEMYVIKITMILKIMNLSQTFIMVLQTK